MPVWLPHMYQRGPIPQAPVPLTPPLDLSGAVQGFFEQQDSKRRRQMEAERIQLERQRQAAQAEQDQFQRGISQGYLDLGKQDRLSAEQTKKDQAQALRQKEVEDAWAAYMTAQRSGNASLIAEAGARLSRLGLLDDGGTGGDVPPGDPSGITDPWAEDMATPIEEGSSEAIVPPLGMVGPAQASDVEDIELEEEALPHDIRYPWNDAISETQTGSEEVSSFTDENFGRSEEGSSIPEWVPEGEEQTYADLVRAGEPGLTQQIFEEWQKVGENVAPGDDRAAAEAAGVIEPGEDVSFGEGIDSTPTEPAGPFGGELAQPGAPQGRAFRDPVSGRRYEAPGISSGANPLLVRESLSSLLENAPSEEHKLAAEQAIAMAERIAGGPDVTFEEAIEYGISHYEKRAQQIEAKGLQEMRSKNRFGGGGGGGVPNKWDYKLDKDKLDKLDVYIDKAQSEYNYKGLNEAEAALGQLIAAAGQGTGIGDTMAVTNMVRTVQDRISDQDMRQALDSGGLWSQLMSKVGYVAQGGQKDEQYMQEVRQLAEAAQGVIRERKQRAAAGAANRVSAVPGAYFGSGDELEGAKRYVYDTLIFGAGRGYAPPKKPAAPGSADERARQLLGD